MRYPEYMTAEEIVEFEREYEQWLKEELDYEDQQARLPVTDETNDTWYDDQFETDF